MQQDKEFHHLPITPNTVSLPNHHSILKRHLCFHTLITHLHQQVFIDWSCSHVIITTRSRLSHRESTCQKSLSHRLQSSQRYHYVTTQPLYCQHSDIDINSSHATGKKLSPFTYPSQYWVTTQPSFNLKAPSLFSHTHHTPSSTSIHWLIM